MWKRSHILACYIIIIIITARGTIPALRQTVPAYVVHVICLVVSLRYVHAFPCSDDRSGRPLFSSVSMLEHNAYQYAHTCVRILHFCTISYASEALPDTDRVSRADVESTVGRDG